jgi:hypothetical protein
MEVSGVQASDDLDALVNLLPASWVAATRDVLQGTAAAPTELDAWSALLSGLAWQPPDARPVPLLRLTGPVTSLQLGPPLKDFTDQHGALLRRPTGPSPPGQPPAALANFRATLGRLWGLRW